MDEYHFCSLRSPRSIRFCGMTSSVRYSASSLQTNAVVSARPRRSRAASWRSTVNAYAGAPSHSQDLRLVFDKSISGHGPPVHGRRPQRLRGRVDLNA